MTRGTSVSIMQFDTAKNVVLNKFKKILTKYKKFLQSLKK